MSVVHVGTYKNTPHVEKEHNTVAHVKKVRNTASRENKEQNTTEHKKNAGAAARVAVGTHYPETVHFSDHSVTFKHH